MNKNKLTAWSLLPSIAIGGTVLGGCRPQDQPKPEDYSYCKTDIDIDKVLIPHSTNIFDSPTKSNNPGPDEPNNKLATVNFLDENRYNIEPQFLEVDNTNPFDEGSCIRLAPNGTENLKMRYNTYNTGIPVESHPSIGLPADQVAKQFKNKKIAKRIMESDNGYVWVSAGKVAIVGGTVEYPGVVTAPEGN